VFILNFFILAFFGAIFLIDGLAENLFTPVFHIIGWAGIDFNLWLEDFFQFQLISFETLELIRERLIDLLLNTADS